MAIIYLAHLFRRPGRVIVGLPVYTPKILPENRLSLVDKIIPVILTAKMKRNRMSIVRPILFYAKALGNDPRFVVVQHGNETAMRCRP